ncbi:MAG: relaxase/mobilization nuclease domain-containing protein, partial [Synergistaceae bacterium]|nr:relaxase/mobilization nuclease domain-containing protein [Synergistaceae bacterium]
MIGIIGNPRRDGKSSFGTLIEYCEKNERGQNRAIYTGTRNIHFPESAASEMASLAFMNPRCKDPLMHIILSWRETELPTNKQIDEAVKTALEELDLQDCQAVWTVHADTENRHVHIAANRIHPETYKAIQPAGRWTHRAIQRAARKIEIAQGWEPETHGIYGVTPEGGVIEREGPETENPKLSKEALDLEAHTAQKSAERICQETAAPIIRNAKSWEELHEKLAEQGIAFERKGSGA